MIPLPLRDDTPTYRAPVVTVIIIVVNALVWLFEFFTQQPCGSHSRALFMPAVYDYGAIPAWVVHGLNEGQVLIGECRAVATLHQEVPARLTVLTSMFLHGSWLHIIGNMWFLWIFGDNIEDAMGRVRYVIFYLLCGVIAAGTQILVTPDSVVPMVGASGAIAGVLGGYALLYPRASVRCLWILIIFITTIDLPAWLLLGLWFVSQFFVSPHSGVAAWAHVGGFVAGFGLVRLFVKARPVRPQRVVWQ
ncbi:MAG TPA: rhomboid family intramembrane serine protease [Polyangia bacterium]|nr:rhomboid family intramembrane serine protease [Polyangia bacterium]